MRTSPADRHYASDTPIRVKLRIVLAFAGVVALFAICATSLQDRSAESIQMGSAFMAPAASVPDGLFGSSRSVSSMGLSGTLVRVRRAHQEDFQTVPAVLTGSLHGVQQILSLNAAFDANHSCVVPVLAPISRRGPPASTFA